MELNVPGDTELESSVGVHAAGCCSHIASFKFCLCIIIYWGERRGLCPVQGLYPLFRFSEFSGVAVWSGVLLGEGSGMFAINFPQLKLK